MKCWNCQKMGHYEVVCPEKKKKKRKNQSLAGLAKVEEFAYRFGQEFEFIACESSSAGYLPHKFRESMLFPPLAEHLWVYGMWTVGLHVTCQESVSTSQSFQRVALI